ncbi:MAG: SufE family protein [Chitinophagales bacterium]|jgi:cysteine desulfuration protein SufE|nr:SufE family protein [Sphingobacteriales bacterium]
MNLEEREAELIEIFEWIEDETDRYVQIMDYGKRLPEFPEESRIEQNEVKGCQSKVWLTYKFDNGKLNLKADSNTAITKGIVAILVFLWSDLNPKEIAEASLDILDKIELRKHLTSQRNNGLTAMIQKVKGLANLVNT